MSEKARRVILSVTIAGHDVAGAFAPYLLYFFYKNNIGGKSDEVQLTLHNRDGHFSGEWALKKGLPVWSSPYFSGQFFKKFFALTREISRSRFCASFAA